MTNNIIELTPFRTDLTRAMVRRGDRLLASTDLAADVLALAPLEAYYVIKEIGLDRSLPILLQLSPDQLEACVDLDCWSRNEFAAENLDEWLTTFVQAGPETLAKSFFSLTYVVQLLFLTQIVTVYDPDTDQVPEEDEENVKKRAMTPDGFYLLQLKTEVTLKTHPFSLLDAMYRYDPTATHQLISEVRVDLQAQIEEEALHFRNCRMQDIGFVAPDEAAVLFSKPGSHRPNPASRPRKREDDALTGVPAVYASPLVENTLLQRALSLITDREFLDRLEQEIVWTINSAIIAYGEKTQDTNQITDIAERVRDTISLGLEALLCQVEPNYSLEDAATAAKASDLLDVWCITDLFRHGFAAVQTLQLEAQKVLSEPQFSEWYNMSDTKQSDALDESGEQLDRAFVTALIGCHPLCGGFDPAKYEDVKAFACLADIKRAHARLKRLVAQVRL